MKKPLRLLATLSLAAAAAVTVPAIAPEARAAAPASIRVQGYVSDRTGGTPAPANGTFAIRFTLYDALQAGSLIASAGPLQVAVQNGLYNVEVPFPATAFAGPSLFLEVTINSEVLAPRIPVVSVPYAYLATQASTVAPGAVVNQSLAPGAVSADKLGIPCTDGQFLMRSGGAWTCGTFICNGGDTQDCPYSGPPGTAGVGLCRVGRRTCLVGGTAYGPCSGEVVPTTEICDTKDNDCDGAVDESCAVCGNGIVEPTETCDDGGALAGDGCSATCLVEPGYSCTGQPSVCTFICPVNTANCDGNTANGCECQFTTCCAGACALAHNNGLGQEYGSCNPLGTPSNPSTYTLAMATAARAAWPFMGTNGAGFCGAGNQIVQRVTPSSCAVWQYTGALAGYVSLNTEGSTCLCPTGADPLWD